MKELSFLKHRTIPTPPILSPAQTQDQKNTNMKMSLACLHLMKCIQTFLNGAVFSHFSFTFFLLYSSRCCTDAPRKMCASCPRRYLFVHTYRMSTFKITLNLHTNIFKCGSKYFLVPTSGLEIKNDSVYKACLCVCFSLYIVKVQPHT